MSDRPKCPVCQGEMWWQQDPRSKYPWKPGTPIYVCKRKKEGCTGVIWEPRAAAPSSSAKPWVETETIEEAVAVAQKMSAPKDDSGLLDCLIIAANDWDKLNDYRRENKKETIPLTAEVVAASAHTLFIKRTRN